MDRGVGDVLDEIFRRVTARDVAGTVALFAEDAVLTDPHYPPPVGPAMSGREAVRAGLEWAMSVIERFDLSVVNRFEGPPDRALGAVEVRSRHVVAGRGVVEEKQVFVVELDGAGLVARLEAFTTFPPPG